MQDEIVTHLARSLEIQLVELKATHLNRTPAANPNAEDLALQCLAATVLKGAYAGKEAEGLPSVRAGAGLWRDNQDENAYCLTWRCSGSSRGIEVM